MRKGHWIPAFAGMTECVKLSMRYHSKFKRYWPKNAFT